MTPEQFKHWRKEMNFTQKQACVALGISIQTLGNYERGSRYEDGRQVIIPRTVALACAALKHNLAPWGE